MLENFDCEGESANKTLVPNGCFNIAFINGQGVYAKFGSHFIELKEGIFFCGQATQSVTTSKNEKYETSNNNLLHISFINMLIW